MLRPMLRVTIYVLSLRSKVTPSCYTSMDLVTRLPISTNWKIKSYDSIIVIVNWLPKMIHYKSVKITINAINLAKVILELVIYHHGLLD